MDRSVVSTRSRSPRRRVLSPNPQQLQAIRELNPAQTFPGNQQILEWLNITRSVFDPHHFTIKQLKALVTLLRSNDEDIRSWLRIDPYSDSLGEQPLAEASDSDFQSPDAPLHKAARISSAAPTPRSSMLSLDVIRSSSPRNISCWEELEKGPPGEDNIPDDQHKASIRTPELSHRGLTPFGEASFKKYRCTTGGHLPRARSETKVAFRRHEKEHVDRYYCFSEDSMPYEDAPTGRRCAICKLQDPDQLHFNQHRLQSCLDRKEPKYFTRKDLFRKHLKDDHTLSPQIIDSLAKTQFRPLQITATSCGICVGILFDSKATQIEHIVQKHLINNGNMQSWDTTKMVRSLLRHPEVNTAWNKILELKCDVDERFLCWPECDPLEVPLELDLGTITAERFVTKAFDYALKKKTLRPEDDTRTPLQVTHGLTGSALLNRNPNNDTTAVNNSDNLGMNSRMGVATMTRWNPSLERPDVPTSVPLCGYNSPQQSYGSVSAQGMMNNPIALHGVQIPSGSNEPSRNLGAGNHDRLDPDPYALHDPINDIPTGMDDLGPFAGMSYSEPLDFEPGTYSNEPFNFGDDNQDNVQH